MCFWEIEIFQFSCYSIILFGLIFDLAGAVCIAIPFWNLVKRVKEEIDNEIRKREYLESRKDESVHMRKSMTPSDEIFNVLNDFSNHFMRAVWASRDQKLIRVGIILLCFGFVLQIFGNMLQHWEFVVMMNE